LSKIIFDFINSAKTNNGLDYFEGNRTTVKYAQSIRKSQNRRYLHYGIIPTDQPNLYGNSSKTIKK
jgi:hypothetical protein